jgi:hypothetical protein
MGSGILKLEKAFHFSLVPSISQCENYILTIMEPTGLVISKRNIMQDTNVNHKLIFKFSSSHILSKYKDASETNLKLYLNQNIQNTII